MLLAGCILALPMGGLVGAPLVHRTRVWIVQLIVAIGFGLAAIAYGMTNLHLFPGGGTATGLPMALTILAIVANFMFGVLLNYGVGNYRADIGRAQPDGNGPAALLPDHGGGRRTDGRQRWDPSYPDWRTRPSGRARSDHRRAFRRFSLPPI